MPLDCQMFSDKLRRYFDQLQVTADDVSIATGIEMNHLNHLLQGTTEPSGDEVLILSDYFHCDFRFWISNERLAPFEQTETLYRRFGTEFAREDRWAIQEFLFLCDSEEYLLSSLPSLERSGFVFKPIGNFFKKQGRDAAAALRRFLRYEPSEVPIDVYRDFRRVGMHVFRRKLARSNISGLCIRHPTAGPSILVNYSEDVFRQRFSAAHEAAHAILDADSEVTVTFSRWDSSDLKEVRANAFASEYLLPSAFLPQIPDAKVWNEAKVLMWATKLHVNVETLLIALKGADLIAKDQASRYDGIKVPKEARVDPELTASLSPGFKVRKESLLKRGLSDFYVNLCFNAYDKGLVTAGRLAEMLLVDEPGVYEIAAMEGRRLRYDG